MSHLAQVRAEIKTWERDFANRHGRDPSVQDIRDQPSIAEKYKLYKKLSKAAASHARLPPPKSRPAEPVPPLPGFNPFSPTKKSAKHAHAAHPSTSQASSSARVNPFATPARNKSNPCPRTATPSPDPFPSIPLPLPNANASSHAHTTAVSRARKRLRGEPVSPSPNKPKRQRIRSQAPPPVSSLEQVSSNSEHEVEEELPHCDFTSSFVADSPVKAPAGGKSFKLLFDDIVPALPIAKRPVAPPFAQLDPGPDACFSQRASADQSILAGLKSHHDLRSKTVTSGSEHRVNRIQGKLSSQIFPSKNHLPPPLHKPTFKSAVSQPSQPRTSVKRAVDSSEPVPLQSQCPLIPPSPPPQDSIYQDTVKGKGRGRGKVNAGRKKSRVEHDKSDEGVDSPDDITLKVATINVDRNRHRHADDLEWDPLLGTHNHDPAAKEQADANCHALGTFTVDLPDKFRRVLAISPSRSRNNTEERVVRGLLYGDRVGHYDPSRGGDIWDAGETDEGVLGDAETEDDWEGEPVPWEVGEL